MWEPPTLLKLQIVEATVFNLINSPLDTWHSLPAPEDLLLQIFCHSSISEWCSAWLFWVNTGDNKLHESCLWFLIKFLLTGGENPLLILLISILVLFVQAYSGTPPEEKEKIVWVRFENADLNGMASFSLTCSFWGACAIIPVSFLCSRIIQNIMIFLGKTPLKWHFQPWQNEVKAWKHQTQGRFIWGGERKFSVRTGCIK